MDEFVGGYRKGDSSVSVFYLIELQRDFVQKAGLAPAWFGYPVPTPDGVTSVYHPFSNMDASATLVFLAFLICQRTNKDFLLSLLYLSIRSCFVEPKRKLKIF